MFGMYEDVGARFVDDDDGVEEMKSFVCGLLKRLKLLLVEEFLKKDERKRVKRQRRRLVLIPGLMRLPVHVVVAQCWCSSLGDWTSTSLRMRMRMTTMKMKGVCHLWWVDHRIRYVDLIY